MKILIIRAGALGDTLMLMPLINALSRMHEIVILGRKPGIDYLTPYADKCIDIERGGWHRLFSTGPDIDIPHPGTDHVIAFVSDKENIVSENLSRMFTDAKIDIFSPFPDPDSKTHIVHYMTHALQSAGIPIDPRAVLDAVLDKPVMESHRGAGNKIVLHPGSGSKKKNYPPEFWFELAAHIKKVNHDPSIKICFLLGPAEEDIYPVISGVAKKYDAEVVTCPAKEELLSVLNNTCLYIGHDSGVTHLAAMLGINTLAVFRNSPVEQWRPLGPLVKIIGADACGKDILEVAAGEISAFFNRKQSK